MTREAKLDDIIISALKVLGLEYVGSEMRTQTGRQFLRVFIDNPKSSSGSSSSGVSVEDCERASRQISALLDVEDPFAGRYDLEVSSPGLDRPLFTREHFERFVGSRAKIRLRLPQEGRRNYAGVIKAVEADNIIVVVDDDTFELPLSNIEKANLVPEF